MATENDVIISCLEYLSFVFFIEKKRRKFKRKTFTFFSKSNLRFFRFLLKSSLFYLFFNYFLNLSLPNYLLFSLFSSPEYVIVCRSIWNRSGRRYFRSAAAFSSRLLVSLLGHRLSNSGYPRLTGSIKMLLFRIRSYLLSIKLSPWSTDLCEPTIVNRTWRKHSW